ncbi:MAG: hypothetical protein E7269_00340 [Lachnospiraceae bacterium]|nr:hypothetical protein [Lachnospiraceae bacterium]
MKNKQKKMILIVCCVALIAIFAGLMFLGTKDKPTAPPATRSDLMEEFEEAHTTSTIDELESVDNEGWGELIPLK